MAVIDQHGAAGEIQIRIGEGDDAARGRVDRRALRGGDIDARVRRGRRTIVDALAAEHAADATFHRPGECGGEVGSVVVARANRINFGLLAHDAHGDRRRWVHGVLVHAIDALDGERARHDRDVEGPRVAVRRRELERQRAGFFARDANHEGAIRADPHGTSVVAQHATGRHRPEHQSGLRRARRNLHQSNALRGCCIRRGGLLRYGFGGLRGCAGAAGEGQHGDQRCSHEGDPCRWNPGFRLSARIAAAGRAGRRSTCFHPTRARH